MSERRSLARTVVPAPPRRFAITSPEPPLTDSDAPPNPERRSRKCSNRHHLHHATIEHDFIHDVRPSTSVCSEAQPNTRRGGACSARSSYSSLEPSARSFQNLIDHKQILETDVTPTKQTTASVSNRPYTRIKKSTTPRPSSGPGSPRQRFGTGFFGSQHTSQNPNQQRCMICSP